MPKKTKQQLLEEASELELDVDPDDSWASLNDAVNAALEAEPEESEEDEVYEPMPVHEPAAETSAPETERRSWPFNARGIYVGR